MVRLWQRLGEALGASFLNQYGAVGEDAFSTWSASLSDLSPGQIKTGFSAFMRSDEKYLDLKRFRSCCQDITRFGLVAADRAYEEACLAPSPKDKHKWSHPAVYHAGRLTGWSELHSMPRVQMFPRYERNYSILCKRVAAGEDLTIDIPEAIAQSISIPLTGEENHARMLKMREELGI